MWLLIINILLILGLKLNSSFKTILVPKIFQKSTDLFLNPSSLLDATRNCGQKCLLQIVETDIDQAVNISTTEYKNDLKRTLSWIAAAALFSSIIAALKGPTSAVEFISGYVLELSLSVDNLFVFIVLFDYFAVEKENQNKILNYGIWGAIVMRGIFIGLGSVALKSFHQILIVFAAILFFSSYKIIFSGEDQEEEVFLFFFILLLLLFIINNFFVINC
jgi:hypothetical protein